MRLLGNYAHTVFTRCSTPLPANLRVGETSVLWTNDSLLQRVFVFATHPVSENARNPAPALLRESVPFHPFRDFATFGFFLHPGHLSFFAPDEVKTSIFPWLC
jgi:hypothetical protein